MVECCIFVEKSSCLTSLSQTRYSPKITDRLLRRSRLWDLMKLNNCSPWLPLRELQEEGWFRHLRSPTLSSLTKEAASRAIKETYRYSFSICFVSSSVLYFDMQIQTSLWSIHFFTSRVRTNMVSVNLLCSPSIVFLSSIRFFFVKLFIILIIVRFEFDDLL